MGKGGQDMLLRKKDYDDILDRFVEMEEHIKKQDKWIDELLDTCKTIKESIAEINKTTYATSANSEKVYTDNDGMYDYQKYKKHAKNRKKVGDIDGNV